MQLVDRSKRPFVLTPGRAGLLRGISRGPGTLRLGRGPRPLVADGDQRAGPRGGDLFGGPARHAPLHAGFHAALSQGQGAAGISASQQGLRRGAQCRGRPGHHLLSGRVARHRTLSPCDRADGVGLPSAASAWRKETPSRPSTCRARISSAFDRDLSIRKEIDRYLRQRSVNIRDGDGVRQYRDDQAGGGDRRRRSASCPSRPSARRVATAAWSRSA